MGMIFYEFYLDFYDLFKDVQVIQDILELGKEQRLNKTLKMWSTAIFQKSDSRHRVGTKYITFRMKQVFESFRVSFF